MVPSPLNPASQFPAIALDSEFSHRNPIVYTAGLGSLQNLADSLQNSQLRLCRAGCSQHIGSGRHCKLAETDQDSCGQDVRFGQEECSALDQECADMFEPCSPQRLRGGGDVAIPAGEMAGMKMADLQRALKERNLTTRGGKADLVARLQEALDREVGSNKRSMPAPVEAKRQKIAYKQPKKHKTPIETKEGIEMLKVFYPSLCWLWVSQLG